MAILQCDCKHDYQSKTYGPNKRVHNMKANGQWVCTVCSKVKSGSGVNK